MGSGTRMANDTGARVTSGSSSRAADNSGVGSTGMARTAAMKREGEAGHRMVHGGQGTVARAW